MQSVLKIHNGDVVIHTTYGQVVYILYVQNISSIQYIDTFSICFMDESCASMQRIDKFSIFCVDKTIHPYNISTHFPYIVWTKKLFPYNI